MSQNGIWNCKLSVLRTLYGVVSTIFIFGERKIVMFLLLINTSSNKTLGSLVGAENRSHWRFSSHFFLSLKGDELNLNLNLNSSTSHLTCRQLCVPKLSPLLPETKILILYQLYKMLQ